MKHTTDSKSSPKRWRPRKNQEKAQQLVDTLVHADKETGKTTLNIPVPDKQSVKNILDLVGKLFG